MAVVYFTSNASTGAGSLAEAIQNAAPGDVIRPDETVFERGSTIEIVLASLLSVDKNLTLDASPFRVRLDGGGKTSCVRITGANASFTAFDFVRGAATASGACAFVGTDSVATFDRRLFAGGSTIYGGGATVVRTATATFNDCLFVGCRSTGVNGAGLHVDGTATLNGVTAVGCAASNPNDVYVAYGAFATIRNSIIGKLFKSSAATTTVENSVVDVASSSVGFVASPPDDLTVENWNANAWQTWDLRLLDDASGAPSPYRDSGDVHAASKYDLDGNFRGRETNGASTCSPGAYETIQADLFWIGRDATGAEVVAPSFLTSDGWAASRFATVSGDVAPQAGQTLFIDGVVVFSDDLPTFSGSRASVVVGGFAKVDFNAANYVGLILFSVGYGSLTTTKTRFDTTRSSARVAAWARLTGQIVASTPCEFDANAYVVSGYFYNSFVSPSPTYGALTVAPTTFDRVRLEGVYACDVFKTTAEGSSPTRTIKIGDAATIRARSVSFAASAEAPFETLFDKRVAIELQGDASATVGDGAPASWSDAFEIDATDATSFTLNSALQITCKLPQFNANFGGQVQVVNCQNKPALNFSENANITLDNASLELSELKTAPGSRVDGKGILVFPSNGPWINEGATINGVRAEDYDAATNNIKIVYKFDGSEIRNAFKDGVCRWTSAALDAGTLPFVFGKYSLDSQGKGDYQTIYDSTRPLLDATAPVYETASDWNGETLKTVVHATPEAGWNYYRVEVPAFANLGGAKIYHGGQTTRYFAVWNADYEPEPTYYFCGGATGSFTTTSDWALTVDGVAKFEGAPTSAGAVFVVGRSARLRDFPDDSLQTSVVFPSVVEVYDANGRRLSDAEARLVSVGVPTPSAPEFYVGNGGTSGFWTQCDGATLYRVEAVDGSATGLTESNRWLDANELETKTWRVRVAAPIYGGVQKWSSQTTAVQPFSALVEKANYDDATAGNAFELVYSDDFDGVRDATVERTRKSDGTSTIIAQNFAGGELADVPETFDEYVYRVRWTPSPENVWLETTAAPWFVADGFDAKTQTNFITTPSRAYETPTFAARIEKKSNGELLKRQDVAKISYSLFETRDFGSTRAERLAVGTDGSYWRRDVEIPAATVRDSLLVDPNFWSLDEIGANFVFSPDDGRPFFPRPGDYLVRATLETTNKRRIVVEFPIQVE